MDRGGPRAQRDDVLSADLGGELELELIDVGTKGRNPVGLEGLMNEFQLRFAHVRRGHENFVVDISPRDNIDDLAHTVGDRQVVDVVGLHEADGIAFGEADADRCGLLGGQYLKPVIQARAIEEQPAQIAVGDGSFEAALGVVQQQDAATGRVEPAHRLDHRRGSVNEELVQIRHR